MDIYLCQLTLHDNLFFASREMGLLYETEKYLHNWALSYAFFEHSHIQRPYRLSGKGVAQTPAYLDDLEERSLIPLNRVGLYLFPGRPVLWNYQINTFKAAQVPYYGKADRFGEGDAKRNYPANIGRAKELGVGSTYHTFLVVKDSGSAPAWLPKQSGDLAHAWIRLGKWASKIHIQAQRVASDRIKAKTGVFVCTHPLNPLDLSPQTQLLLYDRIVMPPSSLVSRAQCEGAYWEVDHRPFLPQLINLPQETCYGHAVTSAA